MRRLLVAIISTDYPPLRTSAAVQLRDLAAALGEQGHRAVVIVPGASNTRDWAIERDGMVEILRLNAYETRASSHFRRAIAEIWLPFQMLLSMRRSSHWRTRWDVITWYSPPIVFGPLVYLLKIRSKARCYLILRDIFPEWAVDIGLIRKGVAYHVLKAVAALQYAVADVIGVQTPSNLALMQKWRTAKRLVEVLPNWLTVAPDVGCSIQVASTKLSGRTIFVYVGNMGVAQGMDIFVDLIDGLRERRDIGFVFVGRGSQLTNLNAQCDSRKLDNVLFFNEIDSAEIPGLLAQADVGIVALHPDHKTHNIPGKFVSYIQHGLPVLARVNPGTDLVDLIENENLGRAYSGSRVEELQQLALELADHPTLRAEMGARGRQLGARMFSVQNAAAQITAIRSE